MSTASHRKTESTPLLSLDEAVQRLLDGARRHLIAECETVSTFDALHRGRLRHRP